MTRQFEKILQDCIDLQKEKNSKYKRGEDPLSGFIFAARNSQAKSLPHYIYGRFLEKAGRIQNFYDANKLAIPDLIEELEDSINYFGFQIMALERLIQPKKIDPFIKRTEGNQED